MKKTSWLNKPITWRNLFGLSGIASVIGAISTAVCWIYFFGNPFKKPKKIEDLTTEEDKD